MRLTVYLVAAFQLAVGALHYAGIGRHWLGAWADALSILMMAMLMPLGTWALPLFWFAAFHAFLLISFLLNQRKHKAAAG